MNRSVYFPSLFFFKRKKKNYCVYIAAIMVKKKIKKKKSFLILSDWRVEIENFLYVSSIGQCE